MGNTYKLAISQETITIIVNYLELKTNSKKIINSKRISLSEPVMAGNEWKYVKECIVRQHGFRQQANLLILLLRSSLNREERR